MAESLDITGRLVVAPAVREALEGGRPVVALELTLISHGLPWPQNLDVATRAEAAVHASGATPATVAIHDGRLLVGLEPAALETLATAPPGSVLKAARPSLAMALATPGWAATTVSATMIAAHAAGVRVFATGGIGGVHRGAVAASFDISSDLEELARTSMAVVCAGPKSILDVPATLEYLETRGVPVVAIGQPEMPGFFARAAGVAAPASVSDVAAAAELARVHLGLALGGAILVCVPVPAEDAVPDEGARAAIEVAVADAARDGITGPALTPWLLARIGTLTDGASIRANTSLIVNNARVAGELAARLAMA